MKKIVAMLILYITFLSFGITTYCYLSDRGISNTITLSPASYSIDVTNSEFNIQNLIEEESKQVDVNIKNTWDIRRRIYGALLQDITTDRLDVFNNIYMTIRKFSNDGTTIVDEVPPQRMSYYIQINDVKPGIFDDTNDNKDDALYLEPGEEAKIRFIFDDKNPDSTYNGTSGSFKIRFLTEQSFARSGEYHIMSLLISECNWSLAINAIYTGVTTKVLTNYELNVIKPKDVSIRNTMNKVEIKNLNKDECYSFGFEVRNDGSIINKYGEPFPVSIIKNAKGEDRGFWINTNYKINKWENIYFIWKIKYIDSSEDFTEVMSMPIHMK